MTRVVEVSAEAVAGVRGDVAAVRDTVDADWASLRSRALALGVPTSGFDDVLGAGDRLGTHVLPVVETHLDRARALEDLRYGGALGRPLPVLDVDPAPVALPFGTAPFDDGGTTLTWAATSPGDIAADEQAAADSRGIGDWFSDRWDDVSGAVADGADWVADTAGQAWQTVTEAGAAIGDWWETTTADLGSWIDENLANVRELVGRHVAGFRFLADALQIVGWVLVAVGAVLTVVLGVVGALGGFAAGTLLGGVAGVPGGVAGAAAGATFGLKILGVGFTLVSVGDFLDVVADWGEGTIDGQDLVRLGTLELGLAATSLLGVGVVGKILQKAVKHLPASWRRRLDDWLSSRGGAPHQSEWVGPNGLRLSGDEVAAVDDLLGSAAQHEPTITADLQRMLSGVDGATMPGLEFRLKGEDSLYRKIATDLADDAPPRDVAGAVARIKDAVRYTAQVPDEHFAQGVDDVTDQLTEAGFTPVSWKNTFGQPGYQGINSAWRSPDGQVFELQFHTPTSFDVKMRGHDLYEQLRLPNLSAHDRARLEAEMQRLFDTVPTPPDARTITAPEIP
ncbi:hypothetical protein [Cellulomonas sp. SLBN-39]|uniref:hypothetical protein n=1 Tax=Cellulomonas sp. SLBN-39 TaxID=2768446 RepID=UPI0011513BE4|nr:hypothetical protein [Cellulomonas sp. SLBN-39]TQL02662.1 hypothetical protein FBY24_1742 [Cellulomonas sp. SLBN-39]